MMGDTIGRRRGRIFIEEAHVKIAAPRAPRHIPFYLSFHLKTSDFLFTS